MIRLHAFRDTTFHHLHCKLINDITTLLKKLRFFFNKSNSKIRKTNVIYMEEFVRNAIATFSSPSITALANVITIIGIFVTVSVFLDVRRIKKFYIFTGRITDLSKSLKQHSSKISEYLNDFDGFLPQILEELTRAEVVVKSLERKTNGQLKQSVGKLHKSILSYSSQQQNQDGLRSIYLAMIKIQDEIADYRKDQEWEAKS